MGVATIKAFVHTTWCLYSVSGDIDLVTAAVSSQAAMQMVRSLTHELTRLFPELTSMNVLYRELLQVPAVKRVVAAGLVPTTIKELKLELPQALLEMTGIHNYAIIYHILDVSGCIGVWLHRHRVTDEYAKRGLENDPYLTMPKMQPFINMLTDTIGMLTGGLGNLDEPPVVDNLTHLWMDYFRPQLKEPWAIRESDLSIEIVLCIELYLAAQNILLQVDVDHAIVLRHYAALKIHPFVDDILEIVNDRARSRGKLGSFFRSAEVTQHVKDWLNIDGFWARQAKRKKVMTGERVSSFDEIVFGRKYRDWTRFNQFLGVLIQFVVAQAVCEVRVVFRNLHGCTIPHAHLYNCLRHCRSDSNVTRPLLDIRWPDVKAFLEILGDSVVFKGDRPRTLHTCANRLMLRHDISLVSTAPNPHHGRSRATNKGITHGGLSYDCIPLINAVFSCDVNSRAFLILQTKTVFDAIKTFTTAKSKGNIRIGASSENDYISLLLLFRRILHAEMPALHFIHDRLAIPSKEINDILFESLKKDMTSPGVRPSSGT